MMTTGYFKVTDYVREDPDESDVLALEEFFFVHGDADHQYMRAAFFAERHPGSRLSVWGKYKNVPTIGA